MPSRYIIDVHIEHKYYSTGNTKSIKKHTKAYQSIKKHKAYALEHRRDV